MKLDLVQSFLNAADRVLAHTLDCATQVEAVHMEDGAYRQHGIAAEIRIAGDVEGRVILDLDADMVASLAAGMERADCADAAALESEAVCEVANQVIGNAVTDLNDHGFHFRIQPPMLHTGRRGLQATEDTEALVMSIITCRGRAYINLALRYSGTALTASAD